MIEKGYARWLAYYDTPRIEVLEKTLVALVRRPRFSIIMPVQDSSLRFLDEAMQSVRNQFYPDWELCLVDVAPADQKKDQLLRQHKAADSRINFPPSQKGGEICDSINSAINNATGEFILFLNPEDLLPAHALLYVAKAIEKHPEARLFYSDEDKVSAEGTRHDPHFKSDWNYPLFLSQNFLQHLGVYQRALVQKIAGVHADLGGPLELDLALHCVEQLGKEEIVHIPNILYHSREVFQTDENNLRILAESERILNEHHHRRGINAHSKATPFGYRTFYALPNPPPLTSIVIPTRNNLEVLRICIESIRDKTSYPNYEIIIIDNNSDDQKTMQYLSEGESHRIFKVIHDQQSFNYSALNNKAVESAKGEIIVLLNNDTEVITSEWLNELVSHAIQEGVGAVGARLWYPDDTLQHGGLLLGVCGIANSAHRGLNRSEQGYFNRAVLQQSFSAVTGACLAVRKEVYLEVNGLDTENLPIAFNDVDFCLRLKERGYQNIWTPYAELYHHESLSRGLDTTPENKFRFESETAYMRNCWGELLLNDPAHNPNLSLKSTDAQLAFPSRSDDQTGVEDFTEIREPEFSEIDFLLRQPPLPSSPRYWWLYAPFCRWLMKVHKPRIFLQLGVEEGGFYFDFCKTIALQNLGTKAYAIDFFPDENSDLKNDLATFDVLKKFHNSRYSLFSKLLRGTFQDSPMSFDDASIDILYVHGKASKKMTSRMFELWLPKLSPHSVILFDQTILHSESDETKHCFHELSEEHPSFSFTCGDGLGILLPGRHPAPAFLQLCIPYSFSFLRWHQHFEMLGNHLVLLAEQQDQIDHLEFTLKSLYLSTFWRATRWIREGGDIANKIFNIIRKR